MSSGIVYLLADLLWVIGFGEIVELAIIDSTTIKSIFAQL